MNISSLVGHIVELAALIDKNSRPTDRVVGEFLRTRKYLGSRDRRFIAQAIYGLVRFRKRMEALIDQFVKESPSASDIFSRSQHSLLHYIAYAIAIEKADPKEISSSLTARWKSSYPDIEITLFAEWLARNSSLEFLSGDDIQELAAWYSFQEWMVSEWVEQFGKDETEELLNALNTEAPVTLRVNTLRTGVEECQARLRAEGVETQTSMHSPSALISAKRFNIQACSAFKEGLFELQDEGSQVVCLVAQPQTGSFVIDVCAGAGGKSLSLATLMKNTGKILAFDVEPKRLRELETRARRSGTTIITTQSEGHIDNLKNKADLVLLDAPCSGVGTIRRNPWIKWSLTESLVQHYAEIQSKILEDYSSCVAPGGKLVYSTCSLFRKENEEVVEGLLSRHQEFTPSLPTAMLSQLGFAFDRHSRYLKLLPHKHDTDGFFVAVFVKKECPP